MHDGMVVIKNVAVMPLDFIMTRLGFLASLPQKQTAARQESLYSRLYAGEKISSQHTGTRWR